MYQVFSKENKTLKKYWKIGKKNTGKVREFYQYGKVGTIDLFCGYLIYCTKNWSYQVDLTG